MHAQKSRSEAAKPGKIGVDGVRQAWIQPFRPLVLAFSIAMLLFAVVGIAFTVEGSGRSDTPTTVAFTAGGATLVCGSLYGVQEAGFRKIGRPRRVRRQHAPDHGYGVRVPMTRVLIPLVVSVLIGCAVYTGVASLTWFLGADESLLPSGRSTEIGAVYMTVYSIGSVIGALLLLIIRLDTVVTIYHDGVERYSLRQFPFFTRRYRIFLAWHEIERIDAGSLANQPVIELHTASPLQARQQTPHDTDHKITLLAHVLVTEPNTLLALLKRLHENPDDRKLVSEPNAAELLRPPPIRERLRSARTRKAKK